MTIRHFGSPHQGGGESKHSNDQRNASPSQGLLAERLGAMCFHRDVNDFHVSPLSSRPADGGVQRGGPSGATQHTGADNIIPFPSGRTFLPDSGAKERQPFLDYRELLACLPLLFILVAAALVVFASAFIYAAIVT